MSSPKRAKLVRLRVRGRKPAARAELDIDDLFPPAGSVATGPARLLLSYPSTVRRLAHLSDPGRASLVAIPHLLEKVRATLGTRPADTPAGQAADSAGLLMYLAGLSDAVRALQFLMKRNVLRRTERAFHELAVALEHASIPSMLATMDAAEKASKEPVETLFASLIRR